MGMGFAQTKSLRFIVSIALFTLSAFNYHVGRAYYASHPVAFDTEPIRIAKSLRTQGTFANPFGTMPTGETAHIAPAFPVLLFFVLKFLGDRGAAALLIEAMPVMALSLQAAVLPWLAQWLGFSFWTGVLASVIGVITKPGSEPAWETHIAALLSSLTAATLCLWIRTRTTRSAVLTALLGTILFHFQPVFALPWIASFILMAVRRRLERGVVVLLLAPLLLCVPWSLRNCLRACQEITRTS
jgi:hypothetical protein